MISLVNLSINLRLRILLLMALCAVSAARATAQIPDVTDLRKKVGEKPAPAPARYLGLIGEYAFTDTTAIVLEDGGRLFVRRGRESDALSEKSGNTFVVTSQPRKGDRVVFTRDRNGRATMMQYEGLPFVRRKTASTRAKSSRAPNGLTR